MNKWKIEKALMDPELNMTEIAERIALGPQEDIMNKLEAMNNTYNSDFRVTPTFRWQPGFYAKLSEFYAKMIGTTVQKRKVTTYFNQMENMSWRGNNFRDSIIRLDSMLYEQRSQGMSFQDNTDEVQNAFNDFRGKINETHLVARDMYPSINIRPYYGTSQEEYGRSTLPIPVIIYIIDIKDVMLNVKVGGQDVGVNIDMGDIEVILYIPIIKMIYNRIKGVRRLSEGSYYSHSAPSVKGYYRPTEQGQLYPYITQRYGNTAIYNHPDCDEFSSRAFEYGNCCLGNFAETIPESLWQGDILSAAALFQQWSSMYNIGHTGPLNQIRYAWHGMLPSMQNEQFMNGAETRTHEGCSYRDYLWDEINERNFRLEEGEREEDITSLEDIQADSYCDRYECTLRTSCNAYADVTGVAPAPEVEDNVVDEEGREVRRDDAFDPMSIAVEDIEERFPETAEAIRDIHGGERPENETLEETLIRQYQQAGVNIQHIIPREGR